MVVAEQGVGAVTAVIVVLVLALAAVNGANDVSKGVATLAGAGVTRYRTAIVWGAVTTLAGGLMSLQLGRAMGKLFSAGIVSATPTNAFTLAVLTGTVSWVALATVLRLPVSTTHALVGSLVGAGLAFAPGSVKWHAIIAKVVTPLLASIVVAAGISVLLSLAALLIQRRTRPSVLPVGGPGAAPADPAGPVGPNGPIGPVGGDRALTGLHWFTSGATGCARALNDTPKIAAIGAFTLIPAGWSADQVTLLVAAAMTAGCLLGIPVAHTLGDKVIQMSHGEGCRANAVTAVLVGAGAWLALPMSTTHVSTGAIAGTAGTQVSRLNGRTLRDFALAWTVTPLFTALVAATIYLTL